MSYNESLRSNSNYPAMSQSQWDSAPFNEEDVPDENFEVICSQCLSKTVTVTTNNYIPGASGVDYEPDDEGGYCAVPYHDDPDTSETNWEKVFKDNRLHTPIELIGILKQYVEKDIKETESLEQSYSRNIKLRELKELLDECDDWCNDETTFISD